MKNPLYAVYGVGGCGRGVMPLAREQLLLQNVPINRLVFVDDYPRERTVNSQQVLTYSEFKKVEASERKVVIAIADSAVRKKLVEVLFKDGIKFWSVSAANNLIMDDVQIGEGSILSPFVTITSNVRIGRHFHANIYSYVEHDCVIGDYVTFAPAVKCNGNVLIEDHAYIGAGSMLIQGNSGDDPLVIGRRAIVGMGAVVTRSVPEGMTVLGNPAKELKNED
jgi:sugar O-acyltransferase (sialic acid O-acetyltransferase NeuD family)